MKKHAPPPPDILRKSGPHKDKKKYDRKRVKRKDQDLPDKQEKDQ
jgi:hypothetical protein